MRSEIPGVRQVIALTGPGSEDGWVITTDELAERGREWLSATPDLVDSRIDQLGPESLAVVIYTSGTTGRPKGVRLVQDSVVYEGAVIDAIGTFTKDDLQFLWLPLSHVFGKMLVATGLQIGFPTAVDGRVDKIVENMGLIKPTFMAGPPRIFEKAHGRIALMFAGEKGIKKKLIDWALKVGGEMRDVQARGEEPSSGLKRRHDLATKLVLHKVQERFGGRVRFMISGSAPLNAEVARWFGSVGLLVQEGYGLTETSSGTTVNPPEHGSYQYGSVGWPLPGTEVRIAEEDGEILVKGPGVMRGYHNNPEATAEVLTEDGWFHTGDIGRIDERGFLYVTDRKKDVFKTSGGKYIAPAEIEARFKGLCPFVSQFLVHGAGHNYATALVTLDPDAVAGWAADRRARGQVVRRDRPVAAGARARAGLRRHAQRRPQPLGDDQEVHHPRQGPHDRGGRPHPEHEAAPQGGHGEAPGRARRHVRRVLTGRAQGRAGRSSTIPASVRPGSGKATRCPWRSDRRGSAHRSVRGVR